MREHGGRALEVAAVVTEERAGAAPVAEATAAGVVEFPFVGGVDRRAVGRDGDRIRHARAAHDRLSAGVVHGGCVGGVALGEADRRVVADVARARGHDAGREDAGQGGLGRVAHVEHRDAVVLLQRHHDAVTVPGDVLGLGVVRVDAARSGEHGRRQLDVGHDRGGEVVGLQADHLDEAGRADVVRAARAVFAGDESVDDDDRLVLDRDDDVVGVADALHLAAVGVEADVDLADDGRGVRLDQIDDDELAGTEGRRRAAGRRQVRPHGGEGVAIGHGDGGRFAVHGDGGDQRGLERVADVDEAEFLGAGVGVDEQVAVVGRVDDLGVDARDVEAGDRPEAVDALVLALRANGGDGRDQGGRGEEEARWVHVGGMDTGSARAPVASRTASNVEATNKASW